MAKAKNIQREILAHIASEPIEGLRRTEVLRRMGHIDESYFKTLFRELETEGEIVKKRGGRYVLAANMSLIQGSFVRNPAGFGFVSPDNGGDDVFVPAKSTMGAMTGDRVLCGITSLEEKGPMGEIRRIIEHGRDDFVACLDMEDGRYVVHPMRRDIPGSIPVFRNGPKPNIGKCNIGDWVLAKLMPRTDLRAPLTVSIAMPLGKADSIAGLLAAVAREYGLAEKYAASTEKRAEKITPIELPREDCTNLTTFTVDPADAKDFDDAISIQQEKDGGALIGVHIADVACFVKTGTPLDRAARKRGFTSYLPGRTVGMLPFALSNDLCSLKQDCDRQTHSIFIRVSPEGRVLSSRRAHTTIRSRKRLTFENVEAILESGTAEGIEENILKAVKLLGDITAKMREFRAKQESFLPFTPREVRVLCGGNPPVITGISSGGCEGRASNMIEELMLAANVCVAAELKKKKIPGLYRNHSEPDPEELEALQPMIEDMLNIRKLRLAKRSSFVSFLKKLNKADNGDAITLGLLRCMPRAVYGAESEGHYALGKELYCHFTSPIRRYPDLFVHQQLLAADMGKKLRTNDDAAKLAMECNARETANDQASFAVSDRLKMKYIFDKFNGDRRSFLECTLIRLTASGLSLYIPEYALMAFMPYEQLPGNPDRHDIKDGAIVFARGKRRYRPGDTVLAQPMKIDTISGEMLLRSVRTLI